MQLDIICLFFILGFLAKALGSSIRFPDAMHQATSIFLMLAIGLKGGVALASQLSIDLLFVSLIVMMMGFLLPLIAFPILKKFGGFSKVNAAALAAHFGSVSIGTYAVAVALLESLSVSYEPYFPIFVVLLEFPAMIAGMLLASGLAGRQNLLESAHEIFGNQSIVLLLGGMTIGIIAGEQTDKIMPVFNDLFYGVLALFLLEMGVMSAERVKVLKQKAWFLLSFGMSIPILNGFIGLGLATLLGFSVGGTFLLATLAASASYIAVPSAIKTLIPKADPAVGLTTSLAITFPFNIVAGLPVFWVFSQWLGAG